MRKGEMLIGTTVGETQAMILSHGTAVFNEGFEWGEKRERERIIALLEDPMWHHIAYVPIVAGDKPTTYHDGECLGCRQIALIKGETK
jgi:hypothetical protein